MTIWDYLVEFFGSLLDDKNRRSGRHSERVEVASWVLGPFLAVLFLIWLGSGGSGPLAVGLKIGLALSAAIKIGSVLLLLLLVFSGFNHPADTPIRRTARLVLFLGIVAFWLLQWTTSHPSRKPAASRPVATHSRPDVVRPSSRTEQAWIDEGKRQRLVTRVSELRARVRARWRADVAAAHTTGLPGVVPPMLEVHDEGRDVWQVTNRHSQWVAVRLSRVARPAGASAVWKRCVLDESTPFLEIVAGGKRRFVLEAGCPGSELEFRVGDVARPEPSWWTSTALDEFDRGATPVDAGFEHWSSAQLMDEAGALEKSLAETDRAARWRKELARYDTRVEAG